MAIGWIAATVRTTAGAIAGGFSLDGPADILHSHFVWQLAQQHVFFSLAKPEPHGAAEAFGKS